MVSQPLNCSVLVSVLGSWGSWMSSCIPFSLLFYPKSFIFTAGRGSPSPVPSQGVLSMFFLRNGVRWENPIHRSKDSNSSSSAPREKRENPPLRDLQLAQLPFELLISCFEAFKPCRVRVGTGGKHSWYGLGWDSWEVFFVPHNPPRGTLGAGNGA